MKPALRLMTSDPDLPSYKPSVFYFRSAIRDASDRADIPEMLEVGLALCTELEFLKAWVRAHGLIPPRFQGTRHEAEAKGWIQADSAAARLDDVG